MSYTHELIKIDDNLYCIKDVQSINKYLIIGTEKALLFDTGFGFTDFKDIIKQVTDLPYFVVDSHSDVDHASGNFLFDEVHISTYDYKNLAENDRLDYKTEQLNYRLNKPNSKLKDEMDIEDYFKHSIFDTKYTLIDDGYIFDLGDRKIEVISIPGHSSGSIALYDPKNGHLFTGDSVMKYNVYYMMDNQEPLFVYLNSLRKLQSKVHLFSSIFPGHGEYNIPVTFIQDLIDNVLDLRINHSNDEPLSSFANMSGFKHYYKETLILYSTKRLNEFILQYKV